MSQKKCVCSLCVRGKALSGVAFEAVNQILAMGGTENKRSVLIDNVLSRLRKVSPQRWYARQAPGRILRFLQLRQRPTDEEIEDVQIAYARFVPQAIEANCAANEKFADDLQEWIAMALASNPQYYSRRIGAARELAGALGDQARMDRP